MRTVCADSTDDEQASILAAAHSLSFLQQNSTPFKDLTAEMHGARNNRSHVV